MKLLLDIFTLFITSFFVMAFMMSPMLFGHTEPGSNLQKLVWMILFLATPIYIFSGYLYFDAKFIGFSAKNILITYAVLFTVGLIVFGYGKFLVDELRGIHLTGYSVSGGGAYYNGKKLQGVDVENFSFNFDVAAFESYKYAKDKYHVYFAGKPIENSDPQSFHFIDRAYSIDVGQVYYFGQVLKGAAPESFAHINDFYSKDAQRVYYRDELIDGADPESFVVINNDIADDRNNIYLNGQRIDVDRTSYRWLINPQQQDYYFGIDSKGIYAWGQPILPEADLTTFRIREDMHDIAEDQHRLYMLRGKDSHAIDGVDKQSFGHVVDSDGNDIGRNYYKDKDSVYYYDLYESMQMLRLDGVDVERFHVVSDSPDDMKFDATDGKSYFWLGKIVAK